MNALVVAPDIGSGGVACVVRNLTQYFQSKGHSVEIFHSGASLTPRLRPSALGVTAIDFRLQMPIGDRHPVVSLPAFALLFIPALLQLAWLIWKRRIRAVNIHCPTDELCYFAICRRFLPFALVCSIHGADLFPDGRPRKKYHWGLRMLLRNADRIVTPSDDLRRKVIELFPEHSDKTIYIHNAIDVEKFSSVSSERRSSRGRYLLSVSAYKEQKGLDVLIRAMKRVAEQAPDVKLVLVGDGVVLRRQLEALAADLGLSDCIEFHGKKSPQEVAELLHGCEAFVLPSRFETFGIAILEAMACGRAVVVSRAGGMPEIVQNGYNGLSVPPEDPTAMADALITLCNDPALRHRLGECAFEDVRRRFHLEVMGQSYETAFGFRETAETDIKKAASDENAMPRVEPS